MNGSGDGLRRARLPWLGAVVLAGAVGWLFVRYAVGVDHDVLAPLQHCRPALATPASARAALFLGVLLGLGSAAGAFRAVLGSRAGGRHQGLWTALAALVAVFATVFFLVELFAVVHILSGPATSGDSCGG
ncbi:hypothetical protein [Kitasatospora sp. NBC_00315]|uniref:hypothetical protein n=1 Tax=Kitasatospora sp. NBC_00315 TaxID=2975963 RepID=UPI003247DFDC